jgi:hypothetical protein
MAITTYGELQTAVLNFLGRAGDTEIVARVPEAIALFEAKARRRLKSRVGEVRYNNATIASEYTELPSDLVKLRSVRTVGNDQRALQIVPDDVINLADDGASGVPVRCSVVGTALRVNPIPASTITVQIVYTRLTALSGSSATNWLLDLAPDVYLTGTLGEIGVWTSDERAELWQAKAQAMLDDLNKAHNIGRSAGHLLPTFFGSTV